MPVTGSKHTTYSLSIRLKADGFSFLVTEGFSGDKLLCRDCSLSEGQTLAEALTESLSSDELSNCPVTRVRVITNTDAMCIPQQEFNSDELRSLYSIVFPAIDEQSQEVCYTHLAQLDIVEAFTVPRDIMDCVRKIYPEATFTNASAVVLGRIATYCKRMQLPENSLFAYVTPLRLFLFSLNPGKLQFANSFPLDQPQDSLFFLLSVWKVLGLNARKNHCFIAGEDGSVEFLNDKLQPYLQNIDVMSVSLEN